MPSVVFKFVNIHLPLVWKTQVYWAKEAWSHCVAGRGTGVVTCHWPLGGGLLAAAWGLQLSALQARLKLRPRTDDNSSTVQPQRPQLNLLLLSSASSWFRKLNQLQLLSFLPVLSYRVTWGVAGVYKKPLLRTGFAIWWTPPPPAVPFSSSVLSSSMGSPLMSVSVAVPRGKESEWISGCSSWQFVSSRLVTSDRSCPFVCTSWSVTVFPTWDLSWVTFCGCGSQLSDATSTETHRYPLCGREGRSCRRNWTGHWRWHQLGSQMSARWLRLRIKELWSRLAFVLGQSWGSAFQ